MARAIAYARQLSVRPTDIARALIVAGCALTLIAAGRALPC
jgi:hypothetical protein